MVVRIRKDDLNALITKAKIDGTSQITFRNGETALVMLTDEYTERILSLTQAQAFPTDWFEDWFVHLLMDGQCVNARDILEDDYDEEEQNDMRLFEPMWNGAIQGMLPDMFVFANVETVDPKVLDLTKTIVEEMYSQIPIFLMGRFDNDLHAGAEILANWALASYLTITRHGKL